jgi:hypothetical protein
VTWQLAATASGGPNYGMYPRPETGNVRENLGQQCENHCSKFMYIVMTQVLNEVSTSSENFQFYESQNSAFLSILGW